jgi:sulfur carrier protein ThiS
MDMESIELVLGFGHRQALAKGKGGPMRISVSANFEIEGMNRSGMDVEENATLSDVLMHLGRNIDFPLIDSATKLDPDVEVLLNGKEYVFLPQRLATHLQEDDKVEILVMALGGG